MRYLGRFVSLSMLCLIILLSVSGCSSSGSDQVCQEVSAANAAGIIKSGAGIELPENYTDLHVSQENGMDTLVRFSFKLQRSEMDAFIRQAGFKGKLEQNPISRAVHNANGCTWFTPDSANEYLAGEFFSDKEKLAKKMLIDVSNPEVVVVYMDVFNK